MNYMEQRWVVDDEAESGTFAVDASKTGPHLVSSSVERQVGRDIEHKRVSRILKSRRARAKFFDGELFADPAWDLLLDLYAADLGQRKVSISAACVAADVPATTALRWIRALEERGLIRRQEDPMDRRRSFVVLTYQAASAMDDFFRSTQPCEQII